MVLLTSSFLLISSGQPGDHLPVKTQSEKLVQLKIKVRLCSGLFVSGSFANSAEFKGFVLWFWQGNDHVCSSALSPCGSWLAYSTVSGVRLYRLQHNNNISVTKVAPRTLPLRISSHEKQEFELDAERLSGSRRCPNCPRSSPRLAYSASPRTRPNSSLPPVNLLWL